MAAKSTILLARKGLDEFLLSNNKTVFNQKQLYALIEQNRNKWNLPLTVSPGKIAQKWVDNHFIRLITFRFSDNTQQDFYLYGNPSIFEIAVSLRDKSYISHYPAVQLNDLTNQIPKTIYTTQELSPKIFKPVSIQQETIDQAFSQPQRRSQLFTEYEDYTIILLQGKHSGRSSVLLSTRYDNMFSFTGIERTLIDITVRPNYAGGAFAVLEAWRRAVEMNGFSINKLLVILQKLDFIYPYHQAIGFYLERAGYQKKLSEGFRDKPVQFDFYLEYGMKEKSFDENWKIWYPTGM